MTSWVLAIALALGPASGSAAPQRQVALEIDHTRLLESQEKTAAEETAMFLREDGEAALQKVHGVDVVEDATAPAIVVELSWISYSDSIYRITISTRRPGQEPRLLESVECECIDSGVIESVLDRLPSALAQLDEEPPAEPATEPESELRPEPEPEPGQPDPSPRSERPAAIGALGITGVVMAAGGLGAMGFGISRLAKGDERMPSTSNEERILGRDFLPQGRAWLGIGVGAAVAGATMLAVDLTVLRRRRAARVSLRPAGGPSWTGLLLQGRF